MNEDVLEYELVDIEFELNYEYSESPSLRVKEDGEGKCTQDENKIVYDENGIPKGDSQEERLIRREIIHTFIQSWRAEHNDPRIYNEDLQDYIKINQVFMLESVLHSAIRYESTKALLMMEVVMTNARKIGEVKPKVGNSNQKPFQRMIVMRYSSDELGNVKMVVGIRKRTLEKVQYSITVPNPEIPFVDESIRNSDKDKGKKRKKHPK